MPLAHTTMGPYVLGQDIIREFTVTDADGVAVDITGYTVTFAAARRVGDSPVIGTADSTATANLTAPTTGTLQLSIPAASSAGLAPGDYVAQLWVTDTLGRDIPVMQGCISFKGRVIA